MSKTKSAFPFLLHTLFQFALLASAHAEPATTPAAVAPRKPAAASVELTRVSNYPEPIAIVSSTSQPRTLVIHLHGFVFNKARDRSVSAIAKDMEFERIINAHPEAMIVIPGSKGKNQTYQEQFKTAAALEGVIVTVLQQRSLSLDGFDHVVITGHGGSDKTIGQVLKTLKRTALEDQLDRIVLFDSASNVVPADYVKWVKPKSLHRCLQVVYRPNTMAEKKALILKKEMSKVTAGNPEGCHAIFPATSNDPWKVVPAHFEQLVFL